MPKKISKQTYKEICPMIDAGLTKSKISDATGVSVSAIRNLVGLLNSLRAGNVSDKKRAYVGEAMYSAAAEYLASSSASSENVTKPEPVTEPERTRAASESDDRPPLQRCSKSDLIYIIERMTEAFGQPARTFLELELVKMEAYAVLQVLKELKRSIS